MVTNPRGADHRSEVNARQIKRVVDTMRLEYNWHIDAVSSNGESCGDECATCMRWAVMQELLDVYTEKRPGSEVYPAARSAKRQAR